MDIDKLINSRLFIEEQFESTIGEYNDNLRSKESVPFAITFDPRFHEDMIEQKGDLPRCNNNICKAYINRYVKIYEPGNRWKCNICYSMNIIDDSKEFYMKDSADMSYHQNDDFDSLNNAKINAILYKNYPELSSQNYKSYACNKFIFKKPERPTYIFLIEATENILSKGLLDLALESIFEGVKNIENVEESNFVFAFYTDRLFLLNRKMEYEVFIQAENIPFISKSNFLFKYGDVKNINGKLIREFFYDENIKKRMECDLAIPLSILSSFCSESILYIFTMSNIKKGLGKINEENSFDTKNQFYKDITKILISRQISVSIFFAPIEHMPVHQLSVLTRHTGGNLYLYSGFDSSICSIANKFSADVKKDITLLRSMDTICRIRVSDPFAVKDLYGSFFIRQSELMGFPVFNGNQTITFSYEEVQKKKNIPVGTAICFQVVLLKTTLARERYLQIYNHHIPVGNSMNINSFYDRINPFMIVRYFACKNISIAISKHFRACAEEMHKQSIKILHAYRLNTNFSRGDESMGIKHTLCLMNSLIKSIPFRNTSYTPLMFRSMYFYYFLTASNKFTNKIIYPVLIELLGQNGVFDPHYIALQHSSIKNENVYLLDCGTYTFIYFGKDIPNSRVSELVEIADFKNGRCFLENRDTEFSQLIQEFLVEFETEISQLIYIIIDREEFYEKRKDLKISDQCIYKNIFFSYLTDGKCHNSPSIDEFYKEIIFAVQKLIK